MTPELNNLRTFVRSLARRERSLVLVRVALYAGIVLGALLIASTVAVGAGWQTSTTAGLLVFMAGAGLWAAIYVPLRRHWAASIDTLRQARLVEAMDPALRGRLVTSVSPDSERAESADLMALVARRASRRIEGISPAQVHPAGRTQWVAAAASAVGIAALLALLLVPGGPLSLLTYWQDSGQASAAVSSSDNLSELGAARVGDIVLRYVYPDYTGLEPVTIPNSTGEAHGPPGTLVQVSVRSADPVDSAALIAYDTAPLEAEVVDGRSIRGAFTIGTEPGEWQLLLDSAGEPRTTAAFAIVPEADNPPDVTVEGDDRYELALDGSISLPWLARDDYGLVRVTLDVDGRERQLLFEASAGTTERSDRVVLSPLDLGLQEGDSVDVAIVGWDNDSVAGSKAGQSRPIRIEVLGQGARDRRRNERLAALADAMIIVLADHLVDPWPVADTSGGLARWGEALSERYAPINDIIDEYWEDVPAYAPDRPLIEAVVDTARELIRFTQVSYTPGSDDVPTDASFVTTAELRDDAIVALEDAILFLDSLRDAEAFRDVMRRTDEAATLAEQLAEMMQNDDIEPLAMAAQLDQLEAVLQKMQEALAKMQSGPLEELLNQRTQELSSLLEQAREALARGDMDEARELMERIARDLEQMAESVKEQQARQQQAEGDEMAEASALREELQRLETEQRSLQAEVQQMRESSDAGRFEQSEALWQQLKVVTERLQTKSGVYRTGLETADRSFNEKERAASLQDALAQLDQAADARDLQGAQQEAARGHMGLTSSEMAYRLETRSRGGLPGPGAAELLSMNQDLQQVDRLLRQMAEADAQQNPQMAQQMQEIRQRQEQLKQETEAAQQQMEQMGQESSIQPNGGTESLSEAGERMEQAGEGLGRGQPMSAEGSQGAAAQRIKEARESLEQAMRQAQERARQRGQGQGEGEGQGEQKGEENGEGSDGEERDGSRPTGRKIEIPGPEEFRTPEEYRRALLEGMEGDVPEEYRALKRRYYEELVNQ